MLVLATVLGPRLHVPYDTAQVTAPRPAGALGPRPSALVPCDIAKDTVVVLGREPSLSDGVRSGFVRDLFRESFGMPAFLPASLHACRYGSPHCRTGCVREYVRDSFGISFGIRSGCLPASLQVVRYCTALHVDTGALIVGRGAFGIRFGIRLGFVRDSFGMPAFLPALPACMQAGSRYSYQYGTSYHEYSYISVVPGQG